MDNLLRLVPGVLRARGWRLYTKDGKRLIDLWQYGGRAILGHTPPGLFRAFKNNGARGLWSPLPHSAEGRLYKALAALLPGRSFRLYQDEAAFASAPRTLWRPWLDKEAAAAVLKAPVLIPVLPMPFPGAPALLALDPALDKEFPPGDIFSPVVLAAAARSIYDLLAAPERPRYRQIDRALAGNSPWKRRGVYLIHDARIDVEYTALFRRFLQSGFLLPPVEEDPAILPGEMSPGEELKLAVLLGE
jgi:hypothetical protein